MPLAFNESGDAHYYDDTSKAWKPAPVATNAKGEKVYYDGKAWGPRPADKDAELRKAPGVAETAVRGVEEVGRTAAWMGGEAVGGAAGAATGAMAGSEVPIVGNVAGAAVGAEAGGSAGAATAVTMDDAMNAWVNHKLFGYPIDIDKKTMAEDFVSTAKTNLVMGLIGKFLKGGVPGEKDALGQAVQQGQYVKGKFDEKVGEIGRGTMEKVVGAQDQGLAAATAPAQREVLESTTGRTPAQVLTDTSLPREKSGLETPEITARRERLQSGYFARVQGMSDELGRQWETATRGHVEQPIEDLSTIQDAIATESAYAKDKGISYSTGVKKLIAQAKRISRIPLDETEEQFITGSPNKTYVDSSDKLVSGDVEVPTRRDEPDAFVPAPKEPTTVGHVLALRRAASKQWAVAPDGPSRSAAYHIMQKADTQLENSGLTGLDQLRAKSKAFYNTFGHELNRDIGEAPEPTDVAPKMFGNIARANALIDGASSDEMKSLRATWEDYATRQLANKPDMKLSQLIKPEDSAWLGKMYPNSPFTNPQSLAYVDASLNNLAQAPKQMHAFQQSMQQEQTRLLADGAPKVRDLGMKLADEIGGPVGQSLKNKIKAANIKGPQAAADTVTQFFTGMTPENFVQQIAGEQGIAKASVARQMTGSKDETTRFYVARMASDPAVVPWIAGVAGAKVLMGGGAGFYGPMAAMGGALLLRRGVTNAFVKGLGDPAEAEALIKGLSSSRIGVMGPLSQAVFSGISKDVASRLVEYSKGQGVAKGPMQQPEEKEDEE